jgi:hypothetical protein
MKRNLEEEEEAEIYHEVKEAVEGGKIPQDNYRVLQMPQTRRLPIQVS